jgi:hypothetical protein
MKTQNRSTNHITYNADIFDHIKQRVTAGNNGATVFVPHVCNNIDLFGAGFATQVANHYPNVKIDYHLLGKNFLKNNMGHSQVIKVYEDPKFRHKLYFVNMIAQNGIRSESNPRPLNYLGLVKAMNSLSQYIHFNTGFANKSETVEIHAPKFGSGLAGGNWNFICNLIEDIWRPYNVYIYNYTPQSRIGNRS